MAEKKPIDPKVVYALAAIGATQPEMAFVCGVTESVFKRRLRSDKALRHELERGRVETKVSLRRKQVDLALKGNVTMLIWLGKQLLDQRDKRDVEDTTPPDKKAAKQALVLPSTVPLPEFEALLEKMREAGTLPGSAADRDDPVADPDDEGVM